MKRQYKVWLAILAALEENTHSSMDFDSILEWVLTKLKPTGVTVTTHVMEHHLDILVDAGYLQRVSQGYWRLTWDAHVFISSGNAPSHIQMLGNPPLR
ncbi:hypothetical protein [Bordetella genomosp. 13]|uniref:Uncharacterized protein n=1 Tax=Bordetella genomosp. 13 TaxID=463040 RepID=A0A1W6ZDW0_9BORD|nr:hypothetical protein [Bordetella genomosp. 13]ARP95566.1 hypothetical protein CAL15_14950 [Bordetella genomosp. 13]